MKILDNAIFRILVFLSGVRSFFGKEEVVFEKFLSLELFENARPSGPPRLESSAASFQKEFDLRARCAYCGKVTKMKSDSPYMETNEGGERFPNFRERLVCEKCGLNNRLRATYHLLGKLFPDLASKKVYITEEVTPFYDLLKKRIPDLVGGEYFEGNPDRKVFVPQISREIRNEDLTGLTFPDNEFDLVISLEVLEHIPDYKKALAEIYRVLKPGGYFVFSVPFLENKEKTLVRAKLENVTVEYLFPAEYHGDPAADKDCLCFYHFGWDIFETLKKIGFSESGVYTCNSIRFGYLGTSIVFFARK
jgi:SAM-dependent methyltransferase